MIQKVVFGTFVACAMAATLTAQTTTTSRKTTQTHPTTTKPFVISGCVTKTGDMAGGGTATAGAVHSDYSLGSLQYGTSGTAYDEWVRTHHTGAAATTGTMGASSSRASDLMIGAQNTSSVDLSKYVGQRVQITGSLGSTLPGGSGGMNSTAGVGAAATTGTTGTAGTTGTTGVVGSDALQTTSNVPALTVTSVRVLSKSCGGR